jgi:hypothetical protein
MTVSNKTVLVVDNGLFQPFCHVLAKYFDRVLYCREFRHSFPRPEDLIIGTGYDDITRVESIMGHINEVDLFVFPDSYFAEEQAYLRSIGKSVFGGGWGERLELDREYLDEVLKDVGLPTIPTEVVKGMKALRERLQEVEDKYIKVSFVRGLMETWHHSDYKLSKPKIDELEFSLGCLSEEQEFIVQDSLEAKREVGSDQIVVDGKFPDVVQLAVEGKDKTSLSKMLNYSALPKEVRQVNDAIAPALENYRGFYSSEIRVGMDNKPYLIDPCCRHASPCGETFDLMCTNLGDIVEAAANGEMVTPTFTKRYAAQAIITADMAETNSIPIYIDPEVREFVCLYHSAIRESDDQECVIKTDSKLLEIGSVIGLGNSIDEAIKNCRDNAKKIECYKMTCSTSDLDEFKPEITKAA